MISTGVIFAFTYMCIHYLHPIHPPTPFLVTFLPPINANIPSPYTPQNIVSSPVIQFGKRKNTKNKIRNMMFLLIWNKDSYTGVFLVLFPCIYILQPQLIHLFSPFHSSLVRSPWWPWPV
jgi:hypothetical protein